MATRITTPILHIASKRNFNRVIAAVIITLIINNLLFIISAINIAHEYDAPTSILYYITTSFVTRTLAHIVLAVIILKIFPVQLHYDGRCPNCRSKLSLYKYVLQFDRPVKVCEICKEKVTLYKHKFVCSTKY